MGIDYVDKCPIDKVPKIEDENIPFCKYLFPRTSPGFFRSSGGYDYCAIDNVFNWHGVPEEARPVLHDKYLMVVAAIREIRQITAGAGKSSRMPARSAAAARNCRHPAACAMCNKKCPDRVTMQ
jgi:hypothetical protein